ncbi:MAG: hypothetical protein ABSA01_16385 [Anaerolineales bacterium]
MQIYFYFFASLNITIQISDFFTYRKALYTTNIGYNLFMTYSEISLQGEERLVSELAQLGVNYLSRLAVVPTIPRSPGIILAELVRQQSSRVRTALISLLLANPQYASEIPAALKRLRARDSLTLKLFYTAAVYLQQKYAGLLKKFLRSRWTELPDLFSSELAISGESVQERLIALGDLHMRLTGVQLNWAGTYENAAKDLIRRWQMEQVWNQ